MIPSFDRIITKFNHFKLKISIINLIQLTQFFYPTFPMKRLILLLAVIWATRQQPSYYLNQIYSTTATQTKKVLITQQKQLLLTVHVAVGFSVYQYQDNKYLFNRFYNVFQTFSCADMTPQGNVLILGVQTGNILVYNNINGIYTLNQTITTVTSSLQSLSISSDKNYILSGSSDNILRIFKYNPGPGSFVLNQTLTQSTSSVLDVSFSRDGSIALSGSSDKLVRIYRKSGDTFSMVGTLGEATKAVNCIRISRDNSIIASGSEDGYLRIYRVQPNSTYTLSQTIIEEGYPIASLSISADMSQIITASADFRARVYTYYESGYFLNQTLAGSNAKITTIAIQKDNSGFFAGSADLARARQYISCSISLPGCGICLNKLFCSSCSVGYYLKQGKCFKCPNLCITCASDSVCLSCTDGYTLNGATCNKDLSIGQLQNLLLALTIPLFVLFLLTFLGIIYIVMKLRKSPGVNPEVKSQVVQMQKKKKKNNFNITVEQLQPASSYQIDSNKSNVVYETQFFEDKIY